MLKKDLEKRVKELELALATQNKIVEKEQLLMAKSFNDHITKFKDFMAWELDSHYIRLRSIYDKTNFKIPFNVEEFVDQKYKQYLYDNFMI